MFGLWRRWRRRQVLARQALEPRRWQEILASLPVLEGLSAEEQARLRELVVLFLDEKRFEAAGGLVLTDDQRLRIAALACLPILNLGLDYYRNWYAVVVYPAGFVATHEFTDELGLVHETAEPLVGEAWEQGPVILSWEDIESSWERDGFNVVIHEFAHKLDMLVEGPNGLPPLHGDMRIEEWSAAFEAAYEELAAQVEAGEETVLDPYAAESPAEFFAVVSEAFFELPHLLRAEYPKLYELLSRFYRQDPARRLPEVEAGVVFHERESHGR